MNVFLGFAGNWTFSILDVILLFIGWWNDSHNESAWFFVQLCIALVVLAEQSSKGMFRHNLNFRYGVTVKVSAKK